MAGRPRLVRNKASYIAAIDAHTASGPMKMGTGPSIGKTHYLWYNYATQCNQNPGKLKKSYRNLVENNINPAITASAAGFRPSTNYNYSYIAPNRTGSWYDANVKYDNHFYGPMRTQFYGNANTMRPVSRHMTGFASAPMASSASTPVG